MSANHSEITQRHLAPSQTAEFYHDRFVTDQVAAFLRLMAEWPAALVADVGGGCGYFARALQGASGWRVRVLDLDAPSVQACHQHGIDAAVADALLPPVRGDEAAATFNLVLHHLVGRSESETRRLQVCALRAWRDQVPRLCVHEYIYESGRFGGLSGALIYAITSSRLLSSIGQAIARWVPSLRANTFGVGVRFRTAAEWQVLFGEAGWRIDARVVGPDEPISLARRLLFIRSCRRDSFLLVPH